MDLYLNNQMQTTRKAALYELNYLLENSGLIDSKKVEELIARYSRYCKEGIISERDAAEYHEKLIARWRFDDVLSSDGESIKYQVGPDGSQVSQKVINEKVTNAITRASGVAFDDITKTLDPFYEEFFQTMDTLTNALQTDGEKRWEFDVEKIIMDWIKEANPSAGADLEKFMNTEEGIYKNFDKLMKGLDKSKKVELQALIQVFSKIDPDNKHLSDWNEMYNKLGEGSTEEFSTVKFFGQLLSQNVPGLDSKKMDDICKELETVFESREEVEKLLSHFFDRWNLDRDKTIAYCNAMDNSSDLGWELSVAKEMLRLEVSGKQFDRFSSIVFEYAMKLLYEEGAKLANKEIAYSNAYFATAKLTATGMNMLFGFDGVISNTRGMCSMYDNYERLYDNFLELKRDSENDPSNQYKRERAMNALEVCLVFNISASDYYEKSINSANDSLLVELVTSAVEVYDSDRFNDVDELLAWINADKASKEELLKRIQEMH